MTTSTLAHIVVYLYDVMLPVWWMNATSYYVVFYRLYIQVQLHSPSYMYSSRHSKASLNFGNIHANPMYATLSDVSTQWEIPQPAYTILLCSLWLEVTLPQMQNLLCHSNYDEYACAVTVSLTKSSWTKQIAMHSLLYCANQYLQSPIIDDETAVCILAGVSS